MSKDAPHCLQNFEPDRFPALHIGQCISSETLSSAAFPTTVSSKADAPELYGTLATDSPLGSGPYLLGPKSPCFTNQIIHQMKVTKDAIKIKANPMINVTHEPVSFQFPSQILSNAVKIPTIMIIVGTNIIKNQQNNHQPVLLMSCRRLTETAKLGRKNVKPMIKEKTGTTALSRVLAPMPTRV